MDNKLHEINNTILINRMYAGSYLEQGSNIGHEVINLIKTDNDENYIYVNPLGTMDKEYYEENCIDTVLLVRLAGIPNTVEVLAQAWDLKFLGDNEKIKTDHKTDIDTIKKAQVEHVNICYKTKTLEEIHKKNTIDKNAAYYTFKAKELRRPNKPMYISFDYEQCNNAKGKIKDVTDGEEYYLFYLNKDSLYKTGIEPIEYKRPPVKDKQYKNVPVTQVVNLAKQSLKMYIKNDRVMYNSKSKQYPNGKIVDQRVVYKQLKDILTNQNYWQTENNTKRVTSLNSNIDKIFVDKEGNECNIVDLLGCNYDELAFSNLFQYIFNSKKDVFKIFVEDKLEKHWGKKIKISDQFIIEREKGHIDLLIIDESKQTIIVIENKIKSDINGEEFVIKEGKIKCQLYDYYHFVNGEIKITKEKKDSDEILEDIKNDEVIVYYVRDDNGNEHGPYYSKKEANASINQGDCFKIDKYRIDTIWKEQYKDYQKCFFVFAPKYSNISEKEIYPKDMSNNSIYKLVNYDEIFGFYKDKEADFNSIRYYKDFMYAIKKHTEQVDNVLEKLTQKRFIEAIN